MNKKLPLVITLFILIGFGAAYIYIPKSYPMYHDAISLAVQDEKVTSMLGGQISDGLFGYSKVSRGLATFEIPISGDRGDGMLFVYGKKIDNEWVLERVLFKSPRLQRRHLVYAR